MTKKLVISFMFKCCTMDSVFMTFYNDHIASTLHTRFKIGIVLGMLVMPSICALQLFREFIIIVEKRETKEQQGIWIQTLNSDGHFIVEQIKI